MIDILHPDNQTALFNNETGNQDIVPEIRRNGAFVHVQISMVIRK